MEPVCGYCSSVYLCVPWSQIVNAYTPIGPGSVVGIATGYVLDGPGIESRWGARFYSPVQTGPVAHPASCTRRTGSFPEVKSGRGVTLTTHPLLVLWSWKGRATPLLSVGLRPVQSLSACTRVTFTFFFTLLSYLFLCSKWPLYNYRPPCPFFRQDNVSSRAPTLKANTTRITESNESCVLGNILDLHCTDEINVCLSVHRCICIEKKNQLDVTLCFIALMIFSTCFGHFCAHHQEL